MEWTAWCCKAAECWQSDFTWSDLADAIGEDPSGDAYIAEFWKLLVMNDYPTTVLELIVLIKTEAYGFGWPDPYLGAGKEEWEQVPVTTMDGSILLWDGGAWSPFQWDESPHPDDAWWALLATFDTAWDGLSSDTWNTLVLEPLAERAREAGLEERFQQFLTESENWDTAYAKNYLQWCGVSFTSEPPGQKVTTMEPLGTLGNQTANQPAISADPEFSNKVFNAICQIALETVRDVMPEISTAVPVSKLQKVIRDGVDKAIG